MRQPIRDVRTIHSCFLLHLIILVLMAGCRIASPESATQFRQGVAIVQTDTEKVFLELNAFMREIQLDRAEKLPKLQESDVAPGLDAESLAVWTRAMEVLSLYASALGVLADPAGAKQVEQSLKSLSDRLMALGPPGDTGGSQGDELSRAVSHVGGLIVRGAARRKALELARQADPSVRAVLLLMADMIGSDQTTGGLRATMWGNCTLQADKVRVDFLTAGANKRKVAALYAAAIENRQTSDAALCALRRALLNLADLHTAVAQGRSADAAEVIIFMRQEVTFARELLESARASKDEGRIQ